MVRLRAKIEIEPNSLATRRIRKVPTIARPPIISGSSAATRLRKKSSESRKSSGKASISALLQVLLDLLVDLLLGDRGAADDDAGAVGELFGDRAPASCHSLSSVGFSATAK